MDLRPWDLLRAGAGAPVPEEVQAVHIFGMGSASYLIVGFILKLNEPVSKGDFISS